jgi:putative ABC transport system permease protein
MRWLLRLLVSDADRRAIEADLLELYALRRQRDGERAAARWLRRQRRIYPLHLVRDRVHALTLGRIDPMTTMSPFLRDAAHSMRSLARSPALAATIVLTVGIGLGATTAMLAVVRTVLMSPLPYRDPGSLFWIYTDNPPYRFRFSVVDYRALEADHASFSAVAAYQVSTVTVTDGAQAERVTARAVTGSYFPLLGQSPRLGRLFDPADDVHQDAIAVLTSEYWNRRFAADPDVVGRSLSIEGRRYAIVGVLEDRAGPFENDTAVFTAARWPPPKRKGPFFITALARLRPDVSQEAAVAALRATNARLFPIWQSSYQDERATWGMQDLTSRVVGDAGRTLWIALAAVVVVLLIGCSNAMNLVVARTIARRREWAIRSALGASRPRLVQHLVAESMVLTAAATAVGFGVHALVLRLTTTYGSAYIPRLNELQMSVPLLAWLALVPAVCVGLMLPGLRGVIAPFDSALRSGGRSATDAPGVRRLRRSLVAIEFALATPLLIGAALLSMSLGRLQQVEVGIDTDRLLTASVALPGARYPTADDRRGFWERLRERLAALPGVDEVALADSRPPGEAGNLNNFDLEDKPAAPGENQPISVWVAASPGFFAATGVGLLQGRLLDDRSRDENVIVVDRAWAARFFPNERVVGRRLREGGCSTCDWTTVIGVVETVKWAGLDAPDEGTVYYQFVDVPTAFVVLRSPGDAAALQPGLLQAVRELDPEVAATNVATGQDLVAASLTQPRHLSVLAAVFGLTALVLSVVGIYGVMAHFVEQHTREIGIRLALGGDPGAVRGFVVRQGLTVVAAGVAAGLGAALLTSRFLGPLLFGVSSTDLSAIAGVPIGLAAVAAIACLVPGRRAARMDPADVLRDA